MEAADKFDRKVLNTFLVDGRLVAIPAKAKKRHVILRFLTDQFEIERMYTEREVNALLVQFHPDVASLRRYLVDSGLMRRQVVRIVDAAALTEDRPDFDLQVSYWRPREDARDK